MLHRDVKPANVLIANDGRTVLTDFGIATVEGSSALTMTGEVVGSPEFLAPERALGRTPGPESDLWSLGVLLYAAVEGASPFRQNTPLSTLRAIVDEELPPPRRAGPLAPVIEGLLRKDPAERLPAERALRDLRLVAAGAPSARTPRLRRRTPRRWRRSPAAPPPAAPAAPADALPAPPAVTTATAPARPGRDRRTAVALVAGVVVLVLAVAGLAYALLNRGTTTRTPRAPAARRVHRRGPVPGRRAAGRRGRTIRRRTRPGATARRRPLPAADGVGDGEGRAHGVRGRLSAGARAGAGVHGDVHGGAVARRGLLPLGVGGRLGGRSGLAEAVVPRGRGRTKHDTVVVTTYSETGVFESGIGVEVREPVRTTSETVPFSVRCETETPTGGASASPSGADDGY
ncbi:hypothetical protein SHKM778_66030 [Streptomyces sp. KM77-8]|uniref:non-specific serine/threonine protein kinase n=1 Tax=Streptomyces haneummycinicus TaxID=3074435 RepID=A0AAT9HSH7_9ACTN